MFWFGGGHVRPFENLALGEASEVSLAGGAPEVRGFFNLLQTPLNLLLFYLMTCLVVRASTNGIK